MTADVHEMRRELIEYWHEKRMYVPGAGSLGAKGRDPTEGSPRLHNLLEIDRDFRSVRGDSRQRPQGNGLWKVGTNGRCRMAVRVACRIDIALV